MVGRVAPKTILTPKHDRFDRVPMPSAQVRQLAQQLVERDANLSIITSIRPEFGGIAMKH